jgi:glycosyltransferase involved in cell wall biosynthesis
VKSPVPKMSAPPTIWMNMSTSANWHRPVVGVLRVEQSLCTALAAIVPAVHFKKCIWRDGKFVEYDASLESAPVHLKRAVDTLLPDTPAMQSARVQLMRSLQTVGVEETLDDDGEEALDISFPLHGAFKPVESGPVCGDVIVTVGLDWDQPYSHEFYNLRKKHGIKIISCCHDIIPMLYPQYCVGDVARHFKEYFTRLIWGSAAVLCFSEQSKRDLGGFCESTGAPDRPLRVVRLGDAVPNKNGEISDGVKDIGAAPFILFVSTIERRKNHEILYRAYHHLCATGHADKLPKMVFVGMPGWGVDDLLKDIEKDPLTQDLILQLNHVSDAELNYLYESATFCVYPSLYEGWGLPVAEALVYGKAILSSNRGSLPEVGGDLVKYLAPWDTYAWADVLLDWAQNPAKVKELEKNAKEKYIHCDWHGTATATLALINEIIAEEADKPLVVLPGYECLTKAGNHFGPCIRSNGTSGDLLYGPYCSLAAGDYTIEVFDTLSQRKPSAMSFELVHGDEAETLLARHLSIAEADCAFNEDGALLSLNLSLPRAVENFQIRCHLFNGGIEISKIMIQRLDKVAPISALPPVVPKKITAVEPITEDIETELEAPEELN